MKRLFVLLLLLCAAIFSRAQTQQYGIIDTADLKLTACDFEKGANAMILFDQGTVDYKYSSVVMERHKRIKIFNDKGKDAANIRIEYHGAHNNEDLFGLKAQTINLVNGAIVITPVDKKSIYTQTVDRDHKAVVFAFPDVRPGSVIELEYSLSTPYSYNYPNWLFQREMPSRYSEFDATFLEDYPMDITKKIYQRPVIDSFTKTVSPRGAKYRWALANISSYSEEPFMDYPVDYQQCILVRRKNPTRTWLVIGGIMIDDPDFGDQLTKHLDNEEVIINKANALKTDEQKIHFIFNTVKDAVRWNETDAWYTVEGVKKAWNKKTGTSTEINLILYHLLKQAGINPFLMALKTRDEGWLDVNHPDLSELNRTVVYYPVDTAKYYVLDASNADNTYNNIPYDLIGLNALTIDVDNKRFGIITIANGSAKEIMLLDAGINADGSLSGNIQISATNYDRINYQKSYRAGGEKKYIEDIERERQGLKISAFKMQNIGIDTLPLIQSYDFKYTQSESDGDYIYLNPAALLGLKVSPFLKEKRIAPVDFRFMDDFSIHQRYHLPKGYKVDALPKSFNLVMPDKSITCKRVIAAQDGEIEINYRISYRKTFFGSSQYAFIQDFYKKMYEMLNEQIVLKKG